MISALDYLSSRLLVNELTGELTLRSVLIADTYTIALIARDTSTFLDGRTDIQITVEKLETCTDLGGSQVKDTLLIQYLAENQVHEGIMSSVIEDCTYDVIDIIPSNVGMLIDFISISNLTSLLS